MVMSSLFSVVEVVADFLMNGIVVRIVVVVGAAASKGDRGGLGNVRSEKMLIQENVAILEGLGNSSDRKHRVQIGVIRFDPLTERFLTLLVGEREQFHESSIVAENLVPRGHLSTRFSRVHDWTGSRVDTTLTHQSRNESFQRELSKSFLSSGFVAIQREQEKLDLTLTTIVAFLHDFIVFVLKEENMIERFRGVAELFSTVTGVLLVETLDFACSA